MAIQQTTDVIIIGGGVIGCSIAYFLRKANREVMLFERGEIGQQASGAAAGLLAPLGPIPGQGAFADLLLASFQQFPALVPELEGMSGLQLGYTQTGSIRVARNARRLARLKQRFETWQAFDLKLAWLNGDEARQREPWLAPNVCGAIYVPAEAQINAAQLVQAYAIAAGKLGAQLHTQTPVVRLLHNGKKVVGVETSQGGIITCKHLVLTAGAWSDQLSSSIGINLPVHPLKGQMIALPMLKPSLQHIIFGESIYVIPRNNEILVGATKEEKGFSIAVTHAETDQLYKKALRLIPTLSTQDIERSWAGIRPATPDSHPIFGPVNGWENLVLACGHNGIGILLSPLTGRSIAEYIVTGRLPALLQPFQATRFHKDDAHSLTEK
ncbi:glycine oxidase ThiO [Dictyobacter formicarum]|uniref:glycine oxidase n=1 Tax=Dictyobacter formicarum TaxID=2778368 RepID=A0ABQ3VHI4_9CHLR|nr:glycine oxidase ThiO [Dictyobacter formicarum]GHO85103.1 glycine oxidase ThiO [Dictyobacter formicarum]